MAHIYVGAGYPDDCFVGSTRKAITPNRLFTYAFFKEWDKEIDDTWRQGCNMMLDSGAYSVFTGTAKIDREEHTRFIEKYGDRFALCAALDVINNPAGSWENWIWQKARVPVFPVYHADDPIDLMHDYISAGADRLGLGGVAKNSKGKKRDANLAYLHKVFEQLTDEDGVPKIKTHGFAMGSGATVYSFPWTTVDAATATRAAELGRMLMFMDGEVPQLQIRGPDVLFGERFLGQAELVKVRERLADNGYTLEEVAEFFPLRLAHNTLEMMRSQPLIPDTYRRPVKTETLFD